MAGSPPASPGEGKGSELRARPPGEVRLPAIEARASAAPRGPALVHRARQGHVLVVDHDVDAAVLLAEALALRGFTTSVAHDGPHALEVARARTPQIAIIDLGLPGLSGYELLPALRALRGSPRCGSSG